MRARLGLLSFVLLALCASACDPTQSDRINALGGNTQGVRNGPLHRPGQPCLVCHDGAIGDPQGFSVAGTIFDTSGSATPVNGARVELTDSTGSGYAAVTNEAGNFYITPNQWTPHYPMTAVVSLGANTKVPMLSLIARDGSCAGCHFEPAGQGSPGEVVLTLEDGGLPP